MHAPHMPCSSRSCCCTATFETVHCVQVGTPDYVAPEVLQRIHRSARSHPSGACAKRSGAYTDAVDVWAIGVLAWEAVGGGAPFAGSTMQETQKNVISKQVSAPQQWPPAYRAFVASCLSREPHMRPSAADLLSHDLLQDWACDRAGR